MAINTDKAMANAAAKAAAKQKAMANVKKTAAAGQAKNAKATPVQPTGTPKPKIMIGDYKNEPGKTFKPKGGEKLWARGPQGQLPGMEVGKRKPKKQMNDDKEVPASKMARLNEIFNTKKK